MGVATAVAIGGLALSAGSTAMSFVQAGKQKKMQREAEAAAAKAMAEARKKLMINFSDERAIKKEPYELQREAMLAAGAQAIEAGVSSERGLSPTAGRVLMAQNEAQGDIRTAMGAEMTDIEKEAIAEDSRLRDLGVQLDLGEVEGAQIAARSAEEAATAATAQGVEGIISTAQQGLNMMPLYFKDSKGATPSSTGALPTGTTLNTTQRGMQSLDPFQQKNLLQNSPFASLQQQEIKPYGMFGNNFSGVGGY